MRRRRAGWARRGVLAVVLLAVAFFPAAGSGGGGQAAACRGAACRQAVTAQRWTAALPGTWVVGSGATGTVPAAGEAYAAVGGGMAVVGAGLTVTAFTLGHGDALWQAALTGFRAGSAVMSVRAWPGVVTVGVAGPAAATRTEVVIDAVTGAVLRRYPAALFGGAVAASAATTVVVGASDVTSYANSTGGIRWRRQTGSGQAWRAAGGMLYVTESAGGYLRASPVTGLRVINLQTGTERTLGPPAERAFAGTLAAAAGGAVLFTSAAGVTAYNGLTGGLLWFQRGAVPEGTDPTRGLVYLTSSSGALLGVDPLTGRIRASVPGSTAGGSGGMYVVRGGVALGLDHGQAGDAWGYSVTAGRVTWTVPGVPWPHYFADVSGLGGSAAQAADTVVIAACKRLAPAPAAPVSPSPAGTAPLAGQGAPGPSGTPGPPTPSPGPAASPSAAPPPRACAAPVLVALSV